MDLNKLKQKLDEVNKKSTTASNSLSKNVRKKAQVNRAASSQEVSRSLNSLGDRLRQQAASTMPVVHDVPRPRISTRVTDSLDAMRKSTSLSDLPGRLRYAVDPMGDYDYEGIRRGIQNARDALSFKTKDNGRYDDPNYAGSVQEAKDTRDALMAMQRLHDSVSKLPHRTYEDIPVFGEEMTSDDVDATLARFDADIAAAEKEFGADHAYTNALRNARAEYAANPSQYRDLNLEQSWAVGESVPKLRNIRDGLDMALENVDAEIWTREQAERWNQYAQEAAAKGWEFTEDDYAAFLEDQRQLQNATGNYVFDVRDQYNYDEAYTYVYLRDNYGQDVANEYEKYVRPIVSERVNQEIMEAADIENNSFLGNAIGSTVFNMGKIVNALDVGVQLVGKALTGSDRPVDYHTTGAAGMLSNAMREEDAERLKVFGDINDWLGTDISFLDGIGLDTLYNVGQDFLNSAANTLVFGKNFAGAAMGLEKFGDEFADARERGAPDSRAAGYALTSAFAEGLGESIEISSYLNTLTRIGRSPGWMAKIGLGLLQTAEGGLGEGVTTVAEQAADKWFMGDYSQFNLRVDELINAGYSPEQAQAIAQNEAEHEIFVSILMGVVGQGVPTAVGGTISTVTDTVSTGADIRKQGNQQALASLMSTATGKDVKAPKTAYGTGRMYNDLTQNGEKYAQNIARDERDQAILEYYKQMRDAAAGEQQDSQSNSEVNENIRKALLKLGQGKNISSRQQAKIDADTSAKATQSAIAGNYLKVDNSKSRAAKASSELAYALPAIKMQPKRGTVAGAHAQADERLDEMNVDTKAKTTTVNGEEVKVTKVANVAQNDTEATVTVKKADGSTADVKISEVTFGKDSRPEAMAYAQDLDTPELANAFIFTTKGSRNLDEIANAMHHAYDMAKSGFNLASIQKSTLTNGLSEHQLQRAYELGVADKAKAVDTQQAAADARQTNNASKAWQSGRINMGTVVYETLSNEQKRNLDLIDVVAGLFGMNVEVFESKANANGRFTEENGSYNKATNTIRLDINAGRYYTGDSMAQTAMLRTMSHELTHAMQRNSPKQYEAYKAAVLDVLERQGANIEELVDAKLAADSSLKNRDEAMDEVVADASETMLRDSDAVERLRELHPEQAKTFAQKVLKLIKRIKDAIREAFGNGKLTKEAQYAIKELDKLAEMWSDMAVATAEASGREIEVSSEVQERVQNDQPISGTDEVKNSMEKQTDIAEEIADKIKVSGARQEDVSFSVRTIADGTKYTLIDTKEILPGNANDSLPRRVRLYMREHFRGVVLPLGITKKVYVRSEAINEYTNPAATIQSETFEAKLNAAKELDNLLKSSTFMRWEPDDGRHPDAVRGWNVWKSRFAVYNKVEKKYSAYEGEVKIKRIARGDLFYDITQIKNITDGDMGQSIITDAQSISDKPSIADADTDVNPEIQKQARPMDALSDREILANALEDVATTPEEKLRLAAYKEGLTALNEKQAELDKNREIVTRLTNELRSNQKSRYNIFKALRETSGLSRGEMTHISRLENTIKAYEGTTRHAPLDKQRYEEAIARVKEYAQKANLTDAEFAQWRDAHKDVRANDEARYLSAADFKELQKARNRMKTLAGQVSEYDQALINLERMKPIQDIVQREGDKVRERMQERIADVRQTYENAALRKSIARRVKKLNDTLINPTDTRHVPDEFRFAVLNLMKAFTNDTSIFDKEALSRLATEYAAIEKSNSDAAGLYDDSMKEIIDDLKDKIGGRRLAKLTEAELKDVRNVVEHFQHIVSDSNKVFFNGRRENIDSLAMEEDLNLSGKQHYETRLNTGKLAKWLNEGQITAPYFFRRLGGVMGKLGNALIEAESSYGVEVNQAKARVQEIMQKHNHKSWANKHNDTLTFTTEEGATITLSREEALGLYATDKRERLNVRQEAHHLSESGITFNRDRSKLKWLGKDRRRPVMANAAKISRNDMQKINGWLTAEQKAYADEMVEYLSTDMARLGNETSRQLHGWSKFDEGYYYPYKTNSDFFNTKLDNVEAALMKNMRHTKRTVRHANNPLVITDFTTTVAEHINNMLLYHNFAVPQDTFMRVYDHHLDKSRTIKSVMKSAYGLGVDRYITQLMKDLYGGITRDPGQDFVAGMQARYKKNAVMMSMSVVFQQPSSIIRAFAQIDPKYFTHIPRFGGWSEAMQYAGTAVIKSIGGFDTSTGKNIVDWMTQERVAEGVMDGIDKLGGFLPGKADQATWGAIWQAVKQEQAAKTGLSIRSEELKQLAGKRFDEVIRLTQVYDSTLSRSQNMRSSSGLMKVFTAFMGEPTVTYNMIYDSLFTQNRGLKHTSATFVAVLGSILLNSALKSLVTAARDDDDEVAYWEKWLKDFTGESINGIVIFNYIPIARDVWSVMQGFSVERSDMEIVNAVREFVELLGKEDKTGWDITKSAVTFGSMMTGIPAKNIWRDVEAVKNIADTWHNELREGWVNNAVHSGFVDQSLTYSIFAPTPVERIYTAALEGNSADAERYREYMILYKGKDDKQINSSLRSEIKKGYIRGDMGDERAIKMLTTYTGMRTGDAEDRVLEWSSERDTGIAYGDMKDAYLAGDISEEEVTAARMKYGGANESTANSTADQWRFEKDTGIAYSDMQEAYIAGEISRQDAINYRVKYGGKNRDDAEADVLKWDCEKDTGIPYDELKDEYINGNVTRKAAENYRVKYGGRKKEDAAADVLKWDYEKRYGHPYTDMKDEYLAGRITKQQAIDARVKYGGVSEKTARRTVEGWDDEK